MIGRRYGSFCSAFKTVSRFPTVNRQFSSLHCACRHGKSVLRDNVRDPCIGQCGGSAGVDESLEIRAIAGYEYGEVELWLGHCNGGKSVVC